MLALLDTSSIGYDVVKALLSILIFFSFYMFCNELWFVLCLMRLILIFESIIFDGIVVLFECRPGSLDVTPKPSPATPRTARKLKTSGSDPDLFSSPKSKTPKDKSPKVVGRSPRSPAIEVTCRMENQISFKDTFSLMKRCKYLDFNLQVVICLYLSNYLCW